MKKIASRLGLTLIPIAVIISGCGPAEEAFDLSLKDSSDNYVTYNGILSEYGGCTDTLDNDGDGLADMADADCHILGPIRDLSLHPFPVGHNFAPVRTHVFPNSPAAVGDFRDRALFTRWFRFLTEPDGYTAAIDLWGPGVNPDFVPLPAPTPVRVAQGTPHQGNNNNVNITDVYDWYAPYLALPPPVAESPSAEVGIPVGVRYDDFGIYGLGYKGGSQGYLKRADTGNLDRPRKKHHKR